ncbi:hypothetical protein [Armatimonas sp.]|uniref:hypothetical protein n=1 Tax=Armatimonas sp. TaxID=1872638 RepID=UPI00286C9911|nr:hypothetical protein [Armatimonas sp.]
MSRTLIFLFEAQRDESLFPGGATSDRLALCELEATDHESPNYLPLNDYVMWFANR